MVRFRHLKICKHVMPSPEMYVNRICRQPMKWWHPNCSQRAMQSMWEFHSRILLFEVQHAVQMGKIVKYKHTKKAELEEGSIIVCGRRSWIVRIWDVFVCTRDRLHSKLAFSLVWQFSLCWCPLEFCSSLPLVDRAMKLCHSWPKIRIF